MNGNFNWNSMVNLEKGWKRTVEWYLENQDRVESVITGKYQEYYQRLHGQGSGA